MFEGRRLLIAYFLMWYTGQPAEAQCEGCTFSTTHIQQLSYLHSRDVTYATFCEGPYEESFALCATHGLDHALVLGAAGRRGPADRRTGASASWSAICEPVTRSSRPPGPPGAAMK